MNESKLELMKRTQSTFAYFSERLKAINELLANGNNKRASFQLGVAHCEAECHFQELTKMINEEEKKDVSKSHM